MKILMTIIFVFVFSFAAFGQKEGSVDDKNKSVIQKTTGIVKDIFGKEPKKMKIKDYSKKYKSRWLPYFTGLSFKYLYNAARATRKEQIVEIWTQKMDMADYEVVDLTLYQVDCASGKLRTIATTVYYTYGVQPNGKQVRKKTTASYQDNINEPFNVAFSGTAPAALYEVACSL